eukprot:360592-Chlamydomonas_euryale.AAC.2
MFDAPRPFTTPLQCDRLTELLELVRLRSTHPTHPRFYPPTPSATPLFFALKHARRATLLPPTRLQCEQLTELLELLPPRSTPSDVADVVSAFWARTVDRSEHFTDVMRRLDKEAQVLLSQRLGYFQVRPPERVGRRWHAGREAALLMSRKEAQVLLSQRLCCFQCPCQQIGQRAGEIRALSRHCRFGAALTRLGAGQQQVGRGWGRTTPTPLARGWGQRGPNPAGAFFV